MIAASPLGKKRVGEGRSGGCRGVHLLAAGKVLVGATEEGWRGTFEMAAYYTHTRSDELERTAEAAGHATEPKSPAPAAPSHSGTSGSK